MSCKDWQNDLVPYLDRRLDAARSGEVERHLAGCASCRREADAMAETWRILGYYPGRTLSGRLPSNSLELAKLQMEIEARWTSRLMKHAPWIASAAVVLLVLTFTVLRPRTTTQPPEDEYTKVLASVAPEDREMVQDLDLYENLDTVQSVDVLQDDQMMQYFDILTSLSDEDF